MSNGIRGQVRQQIEQIAGNLQKGSRIFTEESGNLANAAAAGDANAMNTLIGRVGPDAAQNLLAVASQNLQRAQQQAGPPAGPAEPALERQTPEQRATLFGEARGLVDPQREAIQRRLQELAGQAFEGTAEQLNVRGLSPRSGVFAQELTRQILPQVTQAQVGLEQRALGLGSEFAGAGRQEAGLAFTGGLQRRGQDIGERLGQGQLQLQRQQGVQQALRDQAAIQADREAAERERKRRRTGGLGALAGGLAGLVIPGGGALGALAGSRIGSGLAEGFG